MKRTALSKTALSLLTLVLSALPACGDGAGTERPPSTTDDDVARERQRADAELEEAEERLDEALAELERANEQIAELERNQGDLDAAQTALDAAQADLDDAQQAVDEASNEEELETARADLEAKQTELDTAASMLQQVEAEREAAEQALAQARQALEAARAGVKEVATQRWIVGGWISTADEYTGYLTVVDDLSSSGNIDLSQVVEFGGDIVYASPGGGVVFVGLEEAPIIERWGINDDMQLEKQDEVSLANYGITSTLGGGRNVMQFVEDDRAYYFDNENLQVVVFDPHSMTTTHAFSLQGLAEEGQEHALNFIHRDGDRFIITARYWDLAEGWTTPLVRAAIVDSSDDSVVYIDDRRCGDIAFQVTDDAGNLYLGSHPGHAVYTAAGLSGDVPPPSCMLRINQGESEFDADYFVDLTALSGGVVGGLLQGADNHAYVFKYTGEPITGENWRPSLRGDAWVLYSLELGDEQDSFSLVEGMDAFTAYGNSFTTVVNGKGVPFLVAVEADFSAGQYFDVSEPDSVVEALSFPGFPGHAIAVD